MSTDYQRLAAVSDRPVTLETAQEIGAFKLAEQWADRMSWPWPGQETACDHLAELAHMSALAMWLQRWRPISIHGALLNGAQPEDVAAALGVSLNETFRCWHEWATSQLRLFEGGNLGITEERYQSVLRIFAALGINPPVL
jgi:hypothetical protein